MTFALAEGVEHGQKVRGDAMANETDIHPPSYSHQLWDGVRAYALGSVLTANLLVLARRRS